jgi:hypothetical protein
MTEYGPNPELVTKYGCVEHTSIRYPPRTRGNVRDSDGTAWFGRTGSPGYRCTYTATKDYRKPFRVITSAETLRTFIEEFNIRELNVAGNRESVNPGIRDSTIKIITEGLSK